MAKIIIVIKGGSLVHVAVCENRQPTTYRLIDLDTQDGNDPDLGDYAPDQYYEESNEEEVINQLKTVR